MKKLLFTIVFLLSLTWFLSTEEMKSFNGVPLSSTRDEVFSLMESKGWEFTFSYGEPRMFKKNDASFAGKQIAYMSFLFYEQSLLSITIGFVTGLKNEPSVDIIIQAIKEKYDITENLPSTMINVSYCDKNKRIKLDHNIGHNTLSITLMEVQQKYNDEKKAEMMKTINDSI